MKNFSFLIFIVLFGCIARPTVKVSDASLHETQNTQIIESVKSQAITGDWLVTRGYNSADTLVANVTSTSISHVAVYDAESQMVIEAIGNGVLLTPLEEFVNKSYRLLIIRPRWLSDENSEKVISNAKQLVGKNYDFLGTIGFNNPDRYYCSELAVSIYQEWHRPIEKFPGVIKPSDLYLYGSVLYDSKPRDEI